MHKFVTFIKEFRIPNKKELLEAINSFSKRKFALFFLMIILSLVSTVILLNKINSELMTTVPINGGTLTEGIVGMPTLINPVLALSDADKDLTSIVYSGLMRKLPDGSFIPDLAETYTVSDDGLIYTFKIREDAQFHDGKKVTTEDVIFTVEKIKDPLIKSPRRNGWDGISITKQDDLTLTFTLKQPYLSFMDNMTIGILPLHIWKNVSIPEFSLSPLNIKAVGSGPYQIESVKKDSSNFPEEYKLKRFKNFTLGLPHIKYIKIISYANEKDLIKALLSHSIDQASGINSENAEDLKKEGYTIHTTTLPRIFGIFFNNANNKALADQNVIKALDKALDRESIINEVFKGYGEIIQNPIPNNIFKTEVPSSYKKSKIADAKKILEDDGWYLDEDGIFTKGGIKVETKTKTVRGKEVTEEVKTDNGPIIKLSFSLTTGDTKDLKETAELIKNQFALIGIGVDVKIYETGQLNQLIRSRNYEALLFGQLVNHESSLYSFWHSSQRTDPGLNIAMYNSKKVDGILESIQKISTQEDRTLRYKEFIAEFEKDIPALLIYSPKYLYVTSKNLNNIYFNSLVNSSDRFNSIYNWYANQERVWKIFNKNK
ncbi:MAG: peptide ABC transporter substrate-binding protein [Candidatus Pacebacteria bacterium]|nr:peptide ABC transporter substrate-binding protein [Candidatus Paceibacterota bacterium]